MIPQIYNLQHYFYYNSGLIYFLFFILILEWLIKLFRKDDRR